MEGRGGIGETDGEGDGKMGGRKGEELGDEERMYGGKNLG